MSSLKNFLIENAEINKEEKEVVIGTRFKDEKGNMMKFKIKPMTSKEHGAYQKQSTKIDTSSKKKGMSIDSMKLNLLMALNHCVEPNFSDADFIKKVGVQTPEEAINKVLKAGEIIDLAGEVVTLSGFNSFEEELEEAKN